MKRENGWEEIMWWNDMWLNFILSLENKGWEEREDGKNKDKMKRKKEMKRDQKLKNKKR